MKHETCFGVSMTNVWIFFCIQNEISLQNSKSQFLQTFKLACMYRYMSTKGDYQTDQSHTPTHSTESKQNPAS